MNQRTARKAATREKTITAAKALWREPGSYGLNGIREVAAMIDMSTGAVFSNFDTKDDLWRAAFDCAPPIDGVVTRAAPALLKALQDLVDIRPDLAAGDAYGFEGWDAAEMLLERIKEGLLDEESTQSAALADKQSPSPAMDLAA